MAGNYCNRPYFKDHNDEAKFLDGYVAWKKPRLSSISLNNIPACSDGDNHHPFIDVKGVMTTIFDKLDKHDKKNVAETCRRWANWFLVETKTSKAKLDYNRQLARENNNGLMMATRGKKVVEIMYKCCRFKSVREIIKYHKKLAEKQAAEDSYNLHYSDHSGSEGYYGSDC